MAPKQKPRPSGDLLDNARTPHIDDDSIPTKAQVLDDIREGYRFVKSGGRGQPIDEVHREIVEELASEELTQNAGIRK